MSFLTELCQDHHHTVMVEVVRYLALPDAALTCLPPAPSGDCGSVVQVAGFWLACGQETPVNDENYVITPSVRKNLHNLARVVSAR
jgi:midasin